jgi:hypothetical protein
MDNLSEDGIIQKQNSTIRVEYRHDEAMELFVHLLEDRLNLRSFVVKHLGCDTLLTSNCQRVQCRIRREKWSQEIC